MKYSVIDIGSNSMRLSIYDFELEGFTILFKDKIMAGLAGYVEDGYLTNKGIICAIEALNEFKIKLSVMGMDDPFVFATAAIRNVKNSKEVVEEIRKETGYVVDVISGEAEALNDFIGAMYDSPVDDGLLIDIGGGSTELVPFKNCKALSAKSLPIGSLSLFKECVTEVLLKEGSEKSLTTRIDKELSKFLDRNKEFNQLLTSNIDTIIGVGGTARAARKLANEYFDLSANNRFITAEQFFTLNDALRKKDKYASDLILKKAPERVHTLAPGMLLLEKIMKLTGAKQIFVSGNGAREGYLYNKLSSSSNLS